MTNVLAGEWQSMDGVILQIAGFEPSYTFRSEGFGTILSQGVVTRRSDGTYDANGQGINGPVRLHMWLANADTLQTRNTLLEGSPLAILGQLLPQPIVPFVRQRRQIALREPPPHVGASKPERRTSAPKVDADVLEAIRQGAKVRAIRIYRDRTGVGFREAKQLIEDLMCTLDEQPRRPERDDVVTPGGQSVPVHRDRSDTEPKRRSKRKPAPTPAVHEDPMEELRELIGMTDVKRELENLDDWAWRQAQLREHGEETEAPSMHMCFSGGPGTGKTTVARIVGRLLKKYGLLERGEINEVGRADLVGEFVGQTAPKTEAVIEASLGGVLFIDEAYSLTETGAGGGRDFGGEALAALITGMENHRSELCVIVAGYPAEMERFIDANPGLASRISRKVIFPDFTEPELQQVFEVMAAAQKLTFDPRILLDFQPYVRRAKAASKPHQWGNAREVRNILEDGIEHQSRRLRRLGRKPTRDELLRLELADFAFLAS